MGINLGGTRSRAGERESGTARLETARLTTQLEEAVSAYREALQENTRERVPLDWAMTQINLGNALFRLGERESGTARLTEAVAAYREALQEYTRERVPFRWAATQSNLALVHLAFFNKTRQPVYLDDANQQEWQSPFSDFLKKGLCSGKSQVVTWWQTWSHSASVNTLHKGLFVLMKRSRYAARSSSSRRAGLTLSFRTRVERRFGLAPISSWQDG
jgi:tetratricopeptide (TPR) repeat protein